MQTKYEDDRLSKFVIEHYCICDSHGKFVTAKIDKVRDVLEKTGMDLETLDNHLPAVDGVPVRKAHLESVTQIPELIRRFYPIIAGDKALMHLSFVNPLQLATDVLGITVTPAMASFIRAKLRNLVSFAEVELPFNGKIGGIYSIQWDLGKLLNPKK